MSLEVEVKSISQMANRNSCVFIAFTKIRLADATQKEGKRKYNVPTLVGKTTHKNYEMSVVQEAG